MDRYFTRKKLGEWSIVFLGLCVVLVAVAFIPSRRKGSPQAHCIMNQRNLQWSVRSHQKEHNLQTGDPIDWSKIIGPGLFLETKPVCPVHGESAYTYSPVIPEPGALAAPCQDPEHRPADTKDW